MLSTILQKIELLPLNTRSRQGRYSPLVSDSPRPTHRRQASLSSFNPRKVAWVAGAGLFLLLLFLVAGSNSLTSVVQWHKQSDGDDSPVPFGKSVARYGREFFWWEQFPQLRGYFNGRKSIVPLAKYVPEQQKDSDLSPSQLQIPELVNADTTPADENLRCEVSPPTVYVYNGLPQGMSLPLMGSLQEMGINTGVCYDRINRYGPYGLLQSTTNGGLGIEAHGDQEVDGRTRAADMSAKAWRPILDACIEKNADALSTRPRTVFLLRTWHTFEYTPYRILMLRAMINELSLRSGGQVQLHFLIHVQDDSIPIWASDDMYQQTLKAALPPEFEGMGTLWSVAQMRLVYPPPFPDSIVNFSGGDVYEAYRSLHFPLQYFASKHPEFDYLWQWEMDIRVLGHYGELIDKITTWADKQDRDHLWERSAKFFIPSLYNNSYQFFTEAVREEARLEQQMPISGPQLPREQLLPIPPQPAASAGHSITDLITFSPLFDPSRTQWAFHNDITGYSPEQRPPTRAALIAASRMSRRLLLLMHEETFRNKHTMFPEMFPASIALHYGLKAVYAPITTYLDRDWPAEHANEIFNNAKIGPEAFTAGMDHGEGHFHGPGGSVFGPGEHVFRGASWYSNALFAGYLWRRWLGNENSGGEIEWELGEGNGRMCLPMMILHPIKNDA